MPDSHPAAGARIADRYVIVRELGAGGMGVVFCARDERLGREVAIKVLPASALGDEQARRRLMREARAAAGLEHPGIVHVYDVGETEQGDAFLVMELVKGNTLRALLERGSLSLPARVASLVEVGRALAFSHQRGFVHRDVKPDNVMIRDDGRAVVLDFGLVKEHGAQALVDAATVTATGSFVGTPAYMSPEQARGGAVDGRSDQFSLAVSVFEAVTDQLPWTGKTPIEIVSEILQRPPRRARDVRPQLPAALDEALARAMSRPPEERYPTTSAFVDALESSARALGADDLARAATVAAPHALSPATSVSAAVGPPGPEPPKRRRLMAATVMAMAAAAVAAGVAWHLWSAKAPRAGDAAGGAPLARAGSVLACPPLAARSHDFARSEWLGAAAAHLVCERAAILLGDPSRTLVPAELAAFPRTPGEGFPDEPFDDPELPAKLRTVAGSADAWLDGSVERRPEGFVMMLALRARGGLEFARGEGNGTTLIEAVRNAMAPLVASGALPTAAEAPWRRAWMDGATAGAALALHDLHVAVLVENRDAIARECQATRDRRDVGPGLAVFANALCAERLGEPLPPRPVLDEEGSAPALALAASTLRLYPAKTEADRASLTAAAHRLEEALAGERDIFARALIAATAAEVYYAQGEAEDAKRLALVSVQSSPRLVDVRGTAWHRLGFTTKDSRLTVLASYVAWLPWEPFPHHNMGRVRGDPASLKEGAHRAAALAGAGYWVVNYGEKLVQTGDLVAASTVAAAARSASLSVLVMRAEGQLRAALDTAVASLGRTPAAAATTLEASNLALDASELAAILERPPTHVEDFFDRFLAPDPPPFSNGVVPLFAALSTCSQAQRPVAARCVGRLAELLRAGHFGAAYPGAAEALAGADRYVVPDFAGAARAWRPILSRSSLVPELIRAPMAIAFDRAGETELAERVDAPALQEGALPSLALERGALRAAKRNDCETARRLARLLVEKWELADEKPPSVDRMKKLALRCGK